MKLKAENIINKLSTYFDWWNSKFPTFGHLSLSALYAAIISGIPLLYIYSVEDPYNSLQQSQNLGIFFRALHYYTGQLFLVFGVLHIFEHIYKGGEKEIKFSLWIRISFLVPIIIYIMISGFILKGDQEGVLALHIIRGLLNEIPIINDILTTGQK